MQKKPEPELKIQMLGPFAINWYDGTPCQVSGIKVKALLALLVAQPEKIWQRESLMAILWPDSPQQAAQASLRQAIYRLGQAIPTGENLGRLALALPLLKTSRNTVQVNPDAHFDSDIMVFQKLTRQVEKHNHRTLRDCKECIKRLETAVSLYRGDFLADLFLHDSNAFERWASSIRAELRQTIQKTLQELGATYLDLGQLEKAVECAQRQLAIDSLNESAQRMLMLALARSGNRVAALSQFEQFRQELQKELDVPPSPETVALFKRIQDGQLAGAVTPGMHLRDYLIIEEIGANETGITYRALHPTLDREVAIKKIRPQIAGHPATIQRMEHEARLAAGIDHPNIVPLYDYWRDGSAIYIVMRCMAGDLARLISENGLSIEDILRFLDQVSSALHAVHEAGIIHRDLRPVNILLDESKNFYLTDFGIGPDLGLDSEAEIEIPYFSTLGYAAPELVVDHMVTPQSDIYSLGVILYELLTGEKPFAADTPEKIIRRQLGQPFPSLREKRPELPLALDEVLRRATAKEPAGRFDNPLDLPVAFREALPEDDERWLKGWHAADIPHGQKIHEYEVREKFASGSFSTIYRAYQPAVRREVAMKVILPEYAGQPDFMRRWEAEALIVARLEHPHIVPLYDYWQDSGGIFLIMRLLRGGNLRHHLNRESMQLPELFSLLQQVTSALHAVHEQGIVHRDLKPGNILLDEHNNAYLADFGIAKELAGDTHKTMSGTFIGSPAYISPEQLRNDEVTPQTDIYSLGIILYECLTGHHPYDTSNLVTLIQQHLNEPLPSLIEEQGQLPLSLDRVLNRATAKHPGARHKDVTSLLADFEEALNIHLGAVSVPRYTSQLPLSAERHSSFVARERQLARLDYFLDRTLSGQGQIVFVTGGAGRGKTALLKQFTRQAMEANPQLLVAAGNCNTTATYGDPYLPFRELLGMLTADVDARLRADRISHEHAARLRAALPKTGAAVVEHGPELLEALIPTKALLARGKSVEPDGAPWLEALSHRVSRENGTSAADRQNRLVAHFTSFIHALSQDYPLLLILDDLQWIDNASAGLLFHLGRTVSGYPILIAGAYRREEVALNRDGRRHPMEKVLSESKRGFGDIRINLAELQEAEELHFVNTLLDRQPNRFSDNFREALYDHTGGHALFTVELLRDMRERGDLQRDEEGLWHESDNLNWEALPWRVEGVIEERTGRLDETLRILLSTAAVEGEIFTAESVAQVLDMKPQRVMQLLSRQLQAKHYLVREEDEWWAGSIFLTRYRFSHTLVRQYLYSQISSGEKRLLHGQIAAALEDLLQEEWQPYAASLAWQYQQAGRPQKALPYWLWLGDQARGNYAHAEAESAYRQAIDTLLDMGLKEQAGRTALKLAQVYTADFQSEKAKDTYEQAFALWDPVQSQEDKNSKSLPEATLRLALEPPMSCDPGMIFDDASTFLSGQLFEGLVCIGQDQTVLPALAERWEVLDGGRRYRFHLNRDAAWNDGSSITAADFVFAFRRNLNPETRSPSAHLLYPLKNARAFADGKLRDEATVGIHAVGDHTLEVILERPVAYLPYLMSHTVTFPLHQRVLNACGKEWTTAENMLSNGPFQMIERDEQHIILTRNPHYKGPFPGNVCNVHCKLFDNYEQSLAAFSRDEVDVVTLANVTPESMVQIVRSHGNDLVSIPRWSTFYVNFRCDQPPFNDRRVRQALTYGLDRQALAKHGFQGLRQAATGGFIPPGIPGHSPGIALPYDPQKARALLKSAGYPGGQGFPAVECVTSPGGSRVVSFMMQAWHDVLGLNIRPQKLVWDEFLRKMNNDPAQLSVTGWGADFPDPHNLLAATFTAKRD